MTVVHEAPGAPEAPVEVVDTQSEGSAPEGNAGEQASPKRDRPEVPRSVINRIGALTRKHEEAIREAAQWRERAEAFERMQQQPGQPTQQPQTREPQVDPNAMRAQALQDAKFALKVEEVAKAGKTVPEFNQAVESLSLIGMTDNELRSLIDSDAPTQIIAYLGNHLDEAGDIFAMDARGQARAIAKLEAKLSAAPAVSSAPDPLKPVRSAATKSEPKPGTTEWAAWRNKQVAERRGH